jgi:hypothetical protein
MNGRQVGGPYELRRNACYDAFPSTEVPDWIGTVELEGRTLDLLFFNVGSGRPPTEPLEEPAFSVNEIWAIYDGLELTFDEDCAVKTFEGSALLWGHDYGVADFTESPDYLLGGLVREARGVFADLAGRRIEFRGSVVMGEAGPESSPGEVAIG